MKKITMLAGAAALAFASTASAEIEGEVTVGFSSQYNFRGVNFGDDLIEAGVSLGTSYAGFDLGAGVWVGDTTENAGDTEVDYYASIGKDVTLLGIEGNIEIGYTKYTFPTEGASGDTEEVYISLSTSQYGIDWGLAFYRDLDSFDAWYAEATAGYSHELSSCMSLDLELGLAYSFNDYYGDDGISHYWAGVATPWAISDNATVTPYLKYVLVGEVLDGANSNGIQDDEFLGGVTLSVGF